MEPSTRLESTEEIMQAAGLLPPTAGEGDPAPFAVPLEMLKAHGPRPAGRAAPPPAADGTSYRPSRRPPMILVCVLDDGSRDQGEWFRIRGTRAVIGRAEGDILIPHDEAMSSRHAELVRHMESGRWRWFLTDLKSTNGTYARISKSVLKHGQEILVGSSRFRFDAAPQGAADNGGATARDAPSPPTTYDWEAVEASEVMPSLVELRARGEGQRYLLDQDECWIGSDPQQAAIVLSNDPLASSRHARIFKDARGRWYIENSRSLNGTWLRIDRLPVDSAGQFQMGEQRFLVRVP